MSKWVFFCILIAGLGFMGCSGDGSTLGPDGTPATTSAEGGNTNPPPDTSGTAPPAITLAQLSQEIFTPRCARSGCHSGASPAAGMSLAVDRIAGQIINVSSSTGMKRIDPGNPEGSYLLKKLRGDADINGSQMPLTGGLLTAEQIEKIRAWIEAGAPL